MKRALLAAALLLAALAGPSQSDPLAPGSGGPMIPSSVGSASVTTTIVPSLICGTLAVSLCLTTGVAL